MLFSLRSDSEEAQSAAALSVERRRWLPGALQAGASFQRAAFQFRPAFAEPHIFRQRRFSLTGLAFHFHAFFIIFRAGHFRHFQT